MHAHRVRRAGSRNEPLHAQRQPVGLARRVATRLLPRLQDADRRDPKRGYPGDADVSHGLPKGVQPRGSRCGDQPSAAETRSGESGACKLVELYQLRGLALRTEARKLCSAPGRPSFVSTRGGRVRGDGIGLFCAIGVAGEGVPRVGNVHLPESLVACRPGRGRRDSSGAKPSARRGAENAGYRVRGGPVHGSELRGICGGRCVEHGGEEDAERAWGETRPRGGGAPAPGAADRGGGGKTATHGALVETGHLQRAAEADGGEAVPRVRGGGVPEHRGRRGGEPDGDGAVPRDGHVY